jgi:hypothetical protein
LIFFKFFTLELTCDTPLGPQYRGPEDRFAYTLLPNYGNTVY